MNLVQHQTQLPRRAVSQIEREARELRQLIANTPVATHLERTALDARINQASIKLQLAESNESQLHARETLRELVAQRDGILQADQALARSNATLKALDNELNEAIARDRIELATRADEALQRAINDYKHACLTAARSLRALLNAQRRSAQTPGANHNISNLRVELFEVPHLHPMSDSGSLGTAMIQGVTQFENFYNDQEQAA